MSLASFRLLFVRSSRVLLIATAAISLTRLPRASACGATATTTTIAPVDVCNTCDPALTNVAPQNAAVGEKAFDSDVIDRTGMCATRTLVCNGNQATIELNNAANGVVTGDTTAMIVLMCNAAGTGWVFPPDNTPITTATCAVLP